MSAINKLRTFNPLRYFSPTAQHVRLLQNDRNAKFGDKLNLAAKKKVFEEKKELLRQKQARVSANIREAKNMAKERINVYRENVLTIPNMLSMSRIVSTPLLGYWVCTGSYVPALGLFIYAAVTDFLDGQIARTWPSQRSMAGTILDPLADKFLVGTLFLTLTYTQIIPLPLTALIVFRDVSLVSASLILRFKSLPQPRTMLKFFDPSVASIKFEPTLLSKTNTTLQFVLVGFSMAAPVFGFVSHPGLVGLQCLTGFTTFTSGAEYAVRRDSYKFLLKEEKPPKTKDENNNDVEN